jgi:hypothetical protein
VRRKGSGGEHLFGRPRCWHRANHEAEGERLQGRFAPRDAVHFDYPRIRTLKPLDIMLAPPKRWVHTSMCIVVNGQAALLCPR